MQLLSLHAQTLMYTCVFSCRCLSSFPLQEVIRTAYNVECLARGIRPSARPSLCNRKPPAKTASGRSEAVWRPMMECVISSRLQYSSDITNQRSMEISRMISHALPTYIYPGIPRKSTSLFRIPILEHHLYEHAHHGHRPSSNLG